MTAPSHFNARTATQSSSQLPVIGTFFRRFMPVRREKIFSSEKPLTLPLARAVRRPRPCGNTTALCRSGRNNIPGATIGRQSDRSLPGFPAKYPTSFSGIWKNQNPGSGSPPDSDPPAGLDWDFWPGPSPKFPYNRNHFFHHYWLSDYGGAWQLNWTVHHYDIVHWAIRLY